MIFVDTNILLDVFGADPQWSAWSLAQLRSAQLDTIAINPIVYAELCVRAARYEDVDAGLANIGVTIVNASRPDLFLAAKAFARYRARGGARAGVLPDFFIGAQAALAGAPLVTRDPARFRTYFPGVRLIAP